MTSPITEQREEDLIEMREYLWAIIRDKDTPKKDGIEASKLLARMHHALQADRAVAKPDPKDKLKTGIPKLKPELKKKMDGMLSGVQPS